MKRGGGSQKGATFERSLCVSFSRWFSGGQADDWFWRTSGSGSRATRRHKKNQKLTKYQYGDMTFDRPEGKPLVEYLNFEFRFRKKLEPLGVLYPTDPNYSLLSFWAKASSEAEQSERQPILVTKVNRGQPLIWMTDPMTMASPRQCRAVMAFELRGENTVRVEKNMKHTFKKLQRVCGFLLEEFFTVDPDTVIKVAKEVSSFYGSGSVPTEADGVQAAV